MHPLVFCGMGWQEMEALYAIPACIRLLRMETGSICRYSPGLLRSQTMQAVGVGGETDLKCTPGAFPEHRNAVFRLPMERGKPFILVVIQCSYVHGRFSRRLRKRSTAPTTHTPMISDIVPG